MEKRGNENQRDGKGKQSYAEALKRPTQDQWRGPIITTRSNVLPWMPKSVVGQMSPGLTYDLLCEECVKWGMSMFKVRYMGDNLVLLTPKEGERMEDIIKLNNEWFVCLFEDLKPWFES